MISTRSSEWNLSTYDLSLTIPLPISASFMFGLTLKVHLVPQSLGNEIGV